MFSIMYYTIPYPSLLKLIIVQWWSFLKRCSTLWKNISFFLSLNKLFNSKIYFSSKILLPCWCEQLWLTSKRSCVHEHRVFLVQISREFSLIHLSMQRLYDRQRSYRVKIKYLPSIINVCVPYNIFNRHYRNDQFQCAIMQIGKTS